MRATTRLLDVSINTVTKLLVDLGTACAIYQNETLRNLPCKRVQVDEIWAFCYSKKKNTPPHLRGLGKGDVWTWIAIDADSFGSKIDYAMLVKTYGPASGDQQERRYSSGECCGAIKGTVCGNPIEGHISTSFVERQNLSLRMGNRRFTRLTNGFSKKAENHAHALAIYYMHYNFGRIHKTLRVTPAMEAKVSDHVWSLEEIAKLAD